MIRNMKETAKKAHEYMYNSKLDGYSLRLTEIEELKNMILKGNVFDAIGIAFNYGFVLGNRVTVSGKITKKL